MYVCMYVCMYVRTYVCMYVCMYIYIYIYIWQAGLVARVAVETTPGPGGEVAVQAPGEKLDSAEIRGNHLSNTTCLTHDFFKSGE